jgi:hypothetical protein
MPILEEFMEYNGKRIRPHCLNCKYLDKTLPDTQYYRCHGGSCPDFTLTDEEREYVINHFKITVSQQVPTPGEGVISSLVGEMNNELDKEILAKLMAEFGEKK